MSRFTDHGSPPKLEIVITQYRDQPWRRRFSLNVPIVASELFVITPADALALVRQLAEIEGIEEAPVITRYSLEVSLSCALYKEYGSIDRKIALVIAERMRWNMTHVTAKYAGDDYNILR